MRVLSPLVAFVVLPALGLSACGKSTPSVSTNPDVIAAPRTSPSAKDGGTCLEPAKVLAGIDYTCADGKKRKGTLVVGTSGKAVNLCSKDKEKGCLTSEDYLSFSKTELAKIVPGNVKQGVVIVGVSGSLTFSGPGECASDGEVACVSSSAFPAAAASGLAGKVLTGQSVAGVAGTYAPDLPDVGNVRSIDTVNGTPGTLATCASDGAEGCVVPSGGTIKAAETANFTGWDIRKKRNSSGTVLTFAGLPSQGKSHCRNRANTTVFDNTTAPALVGLDVFDTIDDYNNNLTGLPGEIPAWTMLIGGTTVTVGSDFACGGIYATGDANTGVVGAERNEPAGDPDLRLQHDANGNWQDLTPNYAPGGTAADNLGNGDGCNHASKHCVFKELISGLMVTEVSASTHTWQNALNYCHTLGDGGAANKIPVIGDASYDDWRLPTQKELMQLYNAGVRGLNQTSNLTTFFGDVDTFFWSSSSVSYFTSFAWGVGLGNGDSNGNDGTGPGRAVCVR